MRKPKKILSLILVMTMIMCIFAFTNNSNAETAKTITEAYKYPVVPETDQWRALDSLNQKIKVCHIPEDILKNMTTEALIETVLNYPLMINMFAYDTPQKGYKSVLSYFNGLQELNRRSDAKYELEKYNNKKRILSNKFVDQEKVLNILSSSHVAKSGLYVTSGTVTTPEGTTVNTFYNLTWNDHPGGKNGALDAQDYFESVYPNANRARSINPAYNCHSYAWHSPSSSNKHWINGNEAEKYMNDGSYTETTSQTAGDKVYYERGDHSAVYADAQVSNNGLVISKWGALGLYEHKMLDCPYDANGATYWRR